MENKQRIAGRQFAILVFFFTVGTSIILAPSITTAEAKQSAWISSAIAMGIGCLLVWMYNTLGGKFPGQTINEYSEIVLGKWLGKLISLYFLLNLSVLSALVLRDIGDFVTIQLMPETPIQSIIILFLIITVMGARMGIETIGRTSEIVLPWFLFLFIIFIILISPKIDVKHLQPLLGIDIKSIIRGAMQLLFFPYLELVLLLIVFPHVNSVKSAKKGFMIGVLLGSTLLLTVTVMSILVLGASDTSKHFFPSYVMAKRINIAGFLQRIEVIMAIIWFFSIFYKLVLLFYSSAISLSQLLKLKDYRPLTYPMAMILFVLSMVISPNSVQNLIYFRFIGFPYNLTFGFLIPFVLLVMAKIRKF
ncbi:spore germination protein KB [Paenibacillus sp. yr247]|uniref:GerAB/ArcD/ProY family transporter n=1 Tax=Paenibacillus sp. yr247 TaxID=1761880 RepID=UPI00087F9998|nr:endospore germination permease [Paenibacillus sp. yr247]SDN67008.1 spore germination protein KB [Paenibacillus sp. yr247]